VTRRLYFDNAATSFPKPPQVLEAMTDYATRLGASPGRGAYAEAREAGQLMDQCRERINTLIGGADPKHVVFTLNTSDALNLAIHGLVRPGDHVIMSSPHGWTTTPCCVLSMSWRRAARSNKHAFHATPKPASSTPTIFAKR